MATGHLQTTRLHGHTQFLSKFLLIVIYNYFMIINFKNKTNINKSRRPRGFGVLGFWGFLKGLNKFWSILATLGHLQGLGHVGLFRATFGVWANLGYFGPLRATLGYLGHFGCLGLSRQFWATFGVWPTLGHFGPLRGSNFRF